MGHFRVDPDVNTNIFELERSATPVISPEFVPAAEKLKAGK